MKKDRLLGFIGLAVAIFFGATTMMLKQSGYAGDPGPKLFPAIGAILIAVCSIVLIVKPNKEDKEFMTKRQWIRAALLFVVYIVFTAMLYYLGFTVTVPVVLFVLTWQFSKVTNKDASVKSRLIKSLAYAAIGGVALYLAYVVGLDASVPKGVLWKMLK